MEENILVIHPRDNVAVALRTIGLGEQVVAIGLEGFPALESIPASHKISPWGYLRRRRKSSNTAKPWR